MSNILKVIGEVKIKKTNFKTDAIFLAGATYSYVIILGKLYTTFLI